LPEDKSQVTQNTIAPHKMLLRISSGKPDIPKSSLKFPIPGMETGMHSGLNIY